MPAGPSGAGNADAASGRGGGGGRSGDTGGAGESRGSTAAERRGSAGRTDVGRLSGGDSGVAARAELARSKAKAAADAAARAKSVQAKAVADAAANEARLRANQLAVQVGTPSTAADRRGRTERGVSSGTGGIGRESLFDATGIQDFFDRLQDKTGVDFGSARGLGLLGLGSTLLGLPPVLGLGLKGASLVKGIQENEGKLGGLFGGGTGGGDVAATLGLIDGGSQGGLGGDTREEIRTGLTDKLKQDAKAKGKDPTDFSKEIAEAELSFRPDQPLGPQGSSLDSVRNKRRFTLRELERKATAGLGELRGGFGPGQGLSEAFGNIRDFGDIGNLGLGGRF